MKKSTQRLPDAVDVILDQWGQVRPDLDVSPMGPIGRIKRCAALLEQRLESCFTEFDGSIEILGSGGCRRRNKHRLQSNLHFLCLRHIQSLPTSVSGRGGKR